MFKNSKINCTFLLFSKYFGSDKTNPIDYQADLIVEQLDKDGSTTKTYNFRGCFPTATGQIELSYEDNDVIEQFGVEFQIQYWESNTTS